MESARFGWRCLEVIVAELSLHLEMSWHFEAARALPGPCRFSERGAGENALSTLCSKKHTRALTQLDCGGIQGWPPR